MWQTRSVTKAGVYRGALPEQRRAERRRRLMDAALDIIGTQGWANTTVRGVCEQAKVGPRFFYESFADLDALAAAVHDELVEEAIAGALTAVAAAPDDLPAKARAGTHAIITAFIEDPRRARVVFAEAHGSETLMRRRFDAMRTIAEVVMKQGDELLGLPPGSDTVLQAFALLLTGGVAEMVLVWLDGGLPVSAEQLVDICVEFLLSSADSLPGMAARLSG